MKRLRQILRLVFWVILGVSALWLIVVLIAQGRDADVVVALVAVSVGAGTALVLLGTQQALSRTPRADRPHLADHEHLDHFA